MLMNTPNLQQAAEQLLSLMKRLRQLSPTTPPPQAAQISPSMMAIIDFVGSSPDCGVKEIARGLKLSTPTVSVSIRHLEEAGFLDRRPHPADRRAVQVFLTPKGQQLYEQTNAFQRQTFEKLLTGLTPEERQTLLALLEKAVTQTELANTHISDQRRPQ